MLARAGPQLLDFNPGLLEALAEPQPGSRPVGVGPRPDVDGRDICLNVSDDFSAKALTRGRWRWWSENLVYGDRHGLGLWIDWEPEWCAECCPCRAGVRLTPLHASSP